ncbi:unnamed protein product [Rotaria sp. Silwood2]|nr:unnamed protein product [Rotaria sp. Silwood2]CAF4458274.1 unnamed protein product [Rotaria sp. Silwood2]
MLKRFIKTCPLLSRINLEQNPVLCDIKDSLLIEEKSFQNPISILLQLLNEKSTQSIELYLNFLLNITSIFIKLRQTIEQYQIKSIYLINSIHNQCQQYYEQKIIKPIEISEPTLPITNNMKNISADEQSFDAHFQRPRTPSARIRQVWQPQPQIFSKTTTITELPRQNSSRSSSVASSRVKPSIEPLSLESRAHLITNEWDFAPSSSTAALMLKRAEKMKWNAERKHKREHLDAYQRLQKARQNEQNTWFITIS